MADIPKIDSESLKESLKQFIDMRDVAHDIQSTIKTISDNSSKWSSNLMLSSDVMKNVQKKAQETEKSVSDINSVIITTRDYTTELEYATKRYASALDSDTKNAWQGVVNELNEAVEKQEFFVAAQEDAISNSEKLSSGLMSVFNKIPLAGAFGKSLGFDKIQSDLQDKLVGPLREGIVNGSLSFKSLKSIGTSAFSAIGKAAKSMMANPIFLIGVLLVGAIQRFLELDKAASDFRKTTGLTADQTREIDKSVRSASAELAHLGVTIEGAYKAASALSETFGKSAAGVADNVKFVAAMSANLGISEETSAKTLQNFIGMSGMSSSSAKASMAIAASLAEAAGVAPKAVMEDMANASEKTLTMMRGNVGQMMRLAVESRRVGLSIETVSGAARGHLDFQSSINSEMEMSTLLGKNINLQKMRQLAFEGDLEGMLKEQSKKLKEVGDITKMNAFQQEAVAKAFGMSVGELVKMQAKEKINAEARAAMNKDQLEAYDAQQDKIQELQNDQKRIQELEQITVMFGKDKTKMTKEQLKLVGELEGLQKKQIDGMTREQKMQSQREQSMNALKDVWVQIQDILVPVIDILVKVLTPTLQIVGAFIKGFIKPFQKVADMIFGAGENTKKWEKFSKKMIPVAEKIGEVFGTLYVIIPILAVGFGKIAALASVFSQTMGRFGKIFKPIVSMFRSVVGFVAKMAKNISNVGGLIGKILKPVSFLFKIVSKIGLFFAKWLNPIGWVILAVETLWRFVSDMFSVWSDESTSVFEKILRTLFGMPKAILAALWSPFEMVFDLVGNLFGVDNFGKMITDKVGSAFDNVIKLVVNLFSNFDFSGMWESLKNSVSGVWEWIKSKFDFSFISDKLKGIMDSKWNPGNWFGDDDEPKMARGGVVTKATKVTAGEAGAEAIIPLSEFNPLNSLVDKLSAGLGGSSNSEMLEEQRKTNVLLTDLVTALKAGGISVNMDGKKVSRQLASAEKYDF